MAYDEARSVVVLFGGSAFGGPYLNDTWEWDGSSWQQVGVPSASPQPRVDSAMAYHAHRRRVILSGGNAAFGGGIRDDTWEWDGTTRTWTPLAPLTTMGPRWFHNMVYDRWRSRMVAFGGYRGLGGPEVNETWTFQEVQVAATPTQPTPGQTVALTLDSQRDPGAAYLLAASFGRFPGIPLPGDPRVVSLVPDALLGWSVGSLAPPFLGFQGGLDASGRAAASILLPPEPAIRGILFFVSGVTYDLTGLRTVFTEVEIRIV
jgi:hypothetical protein